MPEVPKNEHGMRQQEAIIDWFAALGRVVCGVVMILGALAIGGWITDQVGLGAGLIAGAVFVGVMAIVMRPLYPPRVPAEKPTND